MNDWVKTPCTIQTSEADDTTRNQRGDPKYILEITYHYEFDGTPYVGDRLKRLPVEGSDPRKVNLKLKEYPAGRETVCYVDPDEPDFAVLKKDSKAGLYSIWFPCLFIIGGAGIMLSALFRR